jgi:hypothetical protein
MCARRRRFEQLSRKRTEGKIFIRNVLIASVARFIGSDVVSRVEFTPDHLSTLRAPRA